MKTCRTCHAEFIGDRCKPCANAKAALIYQQKKELVRQKEIEEDNKRINERKAARKINVYVDNWRIKRRQIKANQLPRNTSLC